MKNIKILIVNNLMIFVHINILQKHQSERSAENIAGSHHEAPATGICVPADASIAAAPKRSR